jgi:hypothetical protein
LGGIHVQVPVLGSGLGWGVPLAAKRKRDDRLTIEPNERAERWRREVMKAKRATSEREVYEARGEREVEVDGQI